MRKVILALASLSVLLLTISCGEKPGSLRKLEDVVPEFTKRLNKASKTGEYENLIHIFDENATIMLRTEFHPEVMQGHDQIIDYLSNFTPETIFQTGDVEVSSLRAGTDYTYIQPDGKSGSGNWQFRLNNRGKISELAIIPAEREGESDY